MATKKQNVRDADKRKRRNGAKPTSAKRSSEAYAYSDRIPMIADVLKTDFGGTATVSELFKKLKTRSGEFNKERRVSATLRYDKRENGDASMFVRDGKSVTLRAKSRRKSAASKRSKSSK